MYKDWLGIITYMCAPICNAVWGQVIFSHLYTRNLPMLARITLILLNLNSLQKFVTNKIQE